MRTLPLPSARMRASHLLALSAFGIAQPTFEVLTKNPDYFVAQGFSATDVVGYGVGLAVIPTLVLMLIELAAAPLGAKAVSIVHQIAIGVLAFLLVGRAIHTYAPPLEKVLLALAAAVVVTRIYRAWQPARMFLSLSALATVFFLGLFLVRAPLGELAETDVAAAETPSVAARTPVVLVVFDEFALSSLMTADGRIDAARYPNFAALARSATWYRSATTVHDYTSWAVPAILTGRVSRQTDLPLLADHRDNLFTLLGETYRVNAVESVTRLCPAHICPRSGEHVGARARKLASYVRTSVLTGRPRSDGPWSNPPALVDRFLRSLHSGPRRQLDVLHVLLPHSPWKYLPSGRTYHSPPPVIGPAHDTWSHDTRYVDHGYGRHLLQVGYVDRVLGRIVARLHATGLWDESLFVVVADHGVSFRPGGHERKVSLDNVMDIAPVPLFVKVPGQQVGRIDDRSARTVDVVPTIADVLGIRLPWRADGRSLLAPHRPPPGEIVLWTSTGSVVKAPWRSVRAGLYGTIARKTRLEGQAAAPAGAAAG